MNIKEKYINAFFKNLTDKDKKEIYFKQYMWHTFSFNKIKCMKGEKAVNSLREKKQNSVYILFQDNENILEIENITYEMIFDNIINKGLWESDCYVVDKNFKWTFIFTHETWVGNMMLMTKKQYIKKYGKLPDNINQNDTHIEVGETFYIGPFFYEIK